jgi:thiosulfate/3-mercaptopyruvate sulfurtransferase
MLTVLPLLAAALLGSDTVLVSPAWLSAHLNEPGVVVVHVDRNRTAYDAGHIEGSQFLPLSAIIVERDGIPNELPPVAQLDSVLESIGIGDKTRVIITGDPLSAARLFFTLDYLGHSSQAALLDGGTEMWVEGGWPVNSAPPPARRATLTPDPQPELVVTGAWIKANLKTPGVILLDARPGTDFIGTPGSTPPTGHIPGARNIFWKTTMGGSPPVLLSRGELEKMFHAAGVRAGDRIVTYCRSGMQASYLYFVARYLGYETKMYDASMAEWTKLAGAPIETGIPE